MWTHVTATRNAQVDGTTLAQELEKYGQLAPQEAIVVCIQLCDAVGHLHSSSPNQDVKLLHRDLKPSNVMVVRQEGALSIKVIDFGLARLVSGGSLTAEHAEHVEHKTQTWIPLLSQLSCCS